MYTTKPQLVLHSFFEPLHLWSILPKPRSQPKLHLVQHRAALVYHQPTSDKIGIDRNRSIVMKRDGREREGLLTYEAHDLLVSLGLGGHGVSRAIGTITHAANLPISSNPFDIPNDDISSASSQFLARYSAIPRASQNGCLVLVAANMGS